MRLNVLIISLLLFFISAHAQDPIPAIGNWREHLPYRSAIDIAAGDGLVYVATPYSLFSVNTADNSTERYSRVTGLSETGISAIEYDETAHKLVIAYQNSNLDIIYRNDIYNIPDIKRDNIIGDKTIYDIYARAGLYYLSTGLGVIVADGNRFEIKDTWFIGNGGGQVKVNGFCSDAVFFFAATAEGLKRIPISANDPADHRNWVTETDAVLNPGECRNVLNLQGKIIAEKNDSLFLKTGNNWTFFYADGWPIIRSNSSDGKLFLCERDQAGNSRVVQLTTNGAVAGVIVSPGNISFPKNALFFKGETWIADLFGCLSRVGGGNNVINYKLNSPQGIATGDILVDDGIFYAASGSVNDSWNYLYNGDGIYVYNQGLWNNINRYLFSPIDSVLDHIVVAVDKRNGSLWSGSFGGGLIHIQTGPAFEIFKQGKLGSPAGDPTSYRVAGLAFDRENQLWIANFGSSQPLKVLKADGSWKSFSVPLTLTENALAQILIDGSNYKWIISPLGNGLLVFDDNGTIDNTGDDRWRRFRSGTGNGNLPGTDVLCIARDKEGNIWVGTNDGVAVIQCPDLAFSGNACDAVWPVVPQGNFAGYLFKGQEIKSIAVDGANRKWIATSNGVFLVNATGEKHIYGFTEDNSPLLSSDVKKIAVDGKTGEVFFATAKGICSFRSTATEGGPANENVLVFPNPVPAGFSGTIAIRGLRENAIVKITELNGRLVYKTRALGGQATWDGRNYNGQQIASGSYLVLVGSENGREELATKIFFISR